jgi:DNA-binding GntR family transcriptional regulator
MTISTAAMQPTARSGRDRALARLREIIADPASQGTFVNEQQLASEVGVSRTPVREALLIMASQGLVELLPKRGAYVPPLSGREITELLDLRATLERHAVEQFVPAGASPVEAMATILAEQHALADVRDPDRLAAFIDLDRLFHQSLVDAAGSRLLSQTYTGLRERQMRVGIAALRRGTDRWQRVCTEHDAIVAALRLGAVPAVHAAIDDHLRLTLATLLAV